MKNENGIEKSAILKGQTLVNIVPSTYYVDMQDTTTTEWSYSKFLYLPNNGLSNDIKALQNVKSNTKYLLRFYVEKNTVSNTFIINNPSELTIFSTFVGIKGGKTGWFNFVLTTEDITDKTIAIRTQNGIAINGDVKINKIMLIEYQQGMENWDIPYFEGMQSVKMPVLTTTGKNLFDGTIVGNYYVNIDGGLVNSSECYASDFIEIKPNTYFSTNTQENEITAFYDEDKNFISSIQNKTFLSPSNARFLRTTIKPLPLLNTFQLEEGTTATSYEPYKSNILTVDEEVELRGIGDVKDELNVATGELTQRIGEIVFDGSETIVEWQNTNVIDGIKAFSFRNCVDNNTTNVNSLSDTYITYQSSGKLNMANGEGISITSNHCYLKILTSKLETSDIGGLKKYLSQNPITVQYELAEESVKTVDLTILDQDNQPQERMKLFPTGYINTSSSTFPPILELKGITHNNKLNMTTTNGTNNTQLTTLDNLALDGIICRDGTVVRDSYDVESGLYTKRVFRLTVDEEFVERYRNIWKTNSNTVCFELYVEQAKTGLPKPVSSIMGIANNITYYSAQDMNRVCVDAGATLFLRLLKEELNSYDVDGLLDWIKRNGAIEVAYQMATPQIIHMQPNMTPYVSTRPYQGSIESQGNALESSFLDYTSEQSIISPKPLGDGDVLRWEQGSQCYVYKNDKEYIPLTSYNQPIGTVLDLEEEDGEQYVENLDGGDIIVDVPFKEKAVYERHLVSHEDNVIYPTQDKLDPTGKIEVDYICGATWQNPNDLADIQHLGTLREDGQYDVTIRRSGDDEIRLMDGTTHISLDGDGLNPSEFELTFFNSGGVEVGKYGDTSHTLEDCVLDSKLETGTVYGETLVNVLDMNTSTVSNATKELTGFSFNSTQSDIEQKILTRGNYKKDTDYTLIFNSDYAFRLQIGYDMTKAEGWENYDIKIGRNIIKVTTLSDTSHDYITLRTSGGIIRNKKVTFSNFVVLEGDYTSYPMDIPYFEGVGSTIVNGFSSCGKNLFSCSLMMGSWSTTQNKPVSNDNFFCTTDFIKVHPNTIVKVSGTAFNPEASGNVIFYDKDKNYLGNDAQVWVLNGAKIPSNAHYMAFHFGVSYLYDINGTVQIEVVDDVSSPTTAYEPYKSVQYTLPTPITLNKVGDVADTYDVVSGVETRKIDTRVFNSKDKFIKSDQYTQDGYTTFQISNVIGLYGWRTAGLGLSSSIPFIDKTQWNTYQGECIFYGGILMLRLSNDKATTLDGLDTYLKANPITFYAELKSPQTIQHTLIPSTVETMQEPTFILPQPLRSVPNGICDRLYWDENKGHYCIEKRVEELKIPLYDNSKTTLFSYSTSWIYRYTIKTNAALFTNPVKLSNNIIIRNIDSDSDVLTYSDRIDIYVGLTSRDIEANLIEDLTNRQRIVCYALATSEIIDLPHLNKKLTLPTQPDTLPIGYKVENTKANPQLGLTIPYKQLNYPSRPQNIDFKMDIADYVLTWDDVKEARQYNIILNDKTIATVKEPQWNSGEEMYGYIMVEAQNELAENLSEELYIKTVPNAPAQLTVAHNPMTDYYDFEISFIKTSAIAEYYTVQYRIDNGEWVYKTIQSDEIDPNSKVLWSFSVYEINEQIEVWATATNEIGTNDILPTATYYMSPTPQWTYRINSKELFVRWMDDSPYDTQYKLRYQYKSDGIFRYAYFEGDKQEIGKLYEALIPLADDEEVSIALCIMSEKENLYTKPIKASKELDPNIKPPKNFNYHWLARGLIEFYWEDNYDVDVEYEAIVEHRLTSGNNEWITDTRIFSATDTEGTGTVYRLEYQMEDLEEIRVKVRMKWAMNETEWSESLTTVFIPVEGNPPQWIRRTQTQEGLLVEWEAQEYVDSYHVYVMSNGEELQHLETMDNFIYVDLDYSNTIDIEIYEATRFSGGIQSDPTDKMCFRPTMDKHQLIHDVVTPDTLTYEIEVDTIQKGIKERQVIHDINTTPKVTSKQPMDVAISSPFTLSFHPLQLDVHQSGAKYYGDTELHIKTLDVKSRDSIEVLTFERITDQYGVDFTVYTPSASKYPITLEVNRVRIVCFGDSKLKSVCRVIGIGHKFNC